jgi:hypothetical protein
VPFGLSQRPFKVRNGPDGEKEEDDIKKITGLAQLE